MPQRERNPILLVQVPMAGFGSVNLVACALDNNIQKLVNSPTTVHEYPDDDYMADGGISATTFDTRTRGNAPVATVCPVVWLRVRHSLLNKSHLKQRFRR